MKVAHMADVHLGARHLNAQEREEDIYRAWYATIKDILKRKCGAVIIAGDLFHNRNLRPETLAVAQAGLEMLRHANVPAFMVLGNHDYALHSKRTSWPQVLEAQGLLKIWSPAGALDIGGYVGGRPIVALSFAGYRERALLLDDLPTLKFPSNSWLVCHIGISDVKPGIPGGIASVELDALRSTVAKVLTGHFHAPWDNGFAYCPGPVDFTSLSDTVGGYYIHDTETGASEYIKVAKYHQSRNVIRASVSDLSALGDVTNAPHGAIWRVGIREIVPRTEVEAALEAAEPLRVQVHYEPGLLGQAEPEAMVSGTSLMALERSGLETALGPDKAALAADLLQVIRQGGDVLDAMWEML